MAEELDEILDNEVEEDFSQETNLHNSISLNMSDSFSEQLNTHTHVKNSLCGNIQKLENGYAKVNLKTTNEMILDDMGLIHSGFIFAAADYAAAVAINEKNLVIIGGRTSFLAPARVDDLIEFEAKAKFEDSRKREVHVVGTIKDIKIFEGTFQAVVLDKHIFKVKIKNAHRQFE